MGTLEDKYFSILTLPKVRSKYKLINLFLYKIKIKYVVYKS